MGRGATADAQKVDAIIARMTITQDDVEYIAGLARLALTEAEKAQLTEQLTAILEYFTRLDELNIEAISPTASVLPLRMVLRDDVVRPSLEREALLANAPLADAGCFEVPAVLDDEVEG